MDESNTIQPGVRIHESLWKEFRQDIQERRGGIRGHLRTELENAIRSYLQASKGGDINDRLRRIESKLDSIEEQGGTPSNQSEGKNNKDSGFSATVKNRLNKIKGEIEREAGDADKVHESVINKAIEDHAGSSRPTIDRYKEMLEQRHIAHKWPINDSSTWWLDTDKFVQVLHMNFPERYDQFTNDYGKTWWDDKVDELELRDDTDLGFQ